MKSIIALGLSLLLVACTGEGPPNATGNTGNLVSSPGDKTFFSRETGRQWPPRGRPNR